MEQVLSYKQLHVCNDIHIDVCFEIEKGEMTMEQSTKHAACTSLKLNKNETNMKQNTKHAAHATQVDKLVEKKAYTHDTDSWK